MRIGTWRYTRFHSSDTLAWLAGGMLTGIGISAVYPVQSSVWLSIGLGVVAAALCFRARWYVVVGVTILGVVIGWLRGSDVMTGLVPTQQLVGQQVTISGVIAEDIQVTARGDSRIVLTALRDERRHYDGSIWTSIRGEKTYRRGDRLVIRGTMRDGFGVFQASATYIDVLSVEPAKDPMLDMRDAFSRAVRTHIVEPAASLGVGFVVGQKTALPPQLDEQLRVVGLTHLVVASGYNLTILVRAAKRLFEKRSKFLVAFSSSLMIVSFVAISGASPSMVRASIVAGLSVLAWYYGRRFHPFVLLVYVAALTAMMNPLYLWADVGWWLSFLAFFGVLIVSPLLLRIIWRRRDDQPPALLQIVMETIAAQVMTLPFILMVFGVMPVLALIANVVSAPLIPLAMLLTSVAGIVAMAIPALGMIISLPAEILLSYFVAVVRTLSQPEWAQVAVGMTPIMMVGAYIVIVTIVLLVWRVTRYNFRSQSLIE